MSGKRVWVLGAGGSGVAAARLARREGASVTLADAGDTPRLRAVASELSAEGVEVAHEVGAGEVVAVGAAVAVGVTPAVCE